MRAYIEKSYLQSGIQKSAAMEALRGYWRRKKYVRLDGSDRRSRRWSRVEVATMGGTAGGGGGGSHRRSGGRKRFWRIRIVPRLRFLRLSTPKRLLIRLRDAYVNMMLRLANSPALAAAGRYSYGGPAMPVRTVKEYDEKMIVEIYKSLVAQGRLLAVEPAKSGE